jgi:hygromycin-B 7''-O-kinase
VAQYREPWDDAPFPALSEDQLRAIIDRHGLGAPSSSMRRLPSTGVVNTVYVLGDRFVLRVPKDLPQALADVYTESVAAPTARAAGVQTPALAVFDDSRDLLDVPYTVYERVEGQSLLSVGDPRDLDPLWRDVGRDLATLQHAVTSCPDRLDRLDTPGRFTSFDRLLDVLVRDGVLHVDNARWFESVLARLAPVAVVGDTFHRFVHDDVQPANVMARDGAYAALIDWGDAGWGDPALDFRYLPLRAVPAAVAGYREVAPPDGDETFDGRIVWDHLTHALWALGRAPAPHRLEWSRPPAARLTELLAFATSERTQLQEWLAPRRT